MSKRAIHGSAVAIALVAAVLLGSVMLRGAFAQKRTQQSSPGAPAQVESAQQEQEQGEQQEQEQGEGREKEEGQEEQPRYTGSIQVPDDQPGMSEQDEATALQSRAKITAAQAKAAAVSRFNGATVNEVTLENEDGSLVYSVLLTDRSGKTQDVKVDAGDAKVLHVEAGESESHESGEGAEGAEN